MTRVVSILLALTMCGCGGGAILKYNAGTGQWERASISSGWDSFTFVTDRDVAAETRGEPPPGTRLKKWRDYWIAIGEMLYHGVSDRDRHIDYIIQKRRSAGLPDIPELEERKFRTRLEVFKGEVDWAAGQEASGKPLHTLHKDWRAFWISQCEQTYRDARLGEPARYHLREARRKAGLAEVECSPPKEKKSRPF